MSHGRGASNCLMAPIEYTDPTVLTVGIAEGWAEPVTDPSLIDWPVRQAAALIPFDVVDGRPVSPGPRSQVQRGRNGLGLWGENPMADAVVTACTANGGRCLLMIERDDGHGWALPGGAIEPGETPVQASARELREETGLAVDAALWRAGTPQVVPDPRASDEAWAVMVANRADLGQVTRLPDVRGADDARRAAWIPADNYTVLSRALQDRYTGHVFPAHVDLLRAALRTEQARATAAGTPPTGTPPVDANRDAVLSETKLDATRAPAPGGYP